MQTADQQDSSGNMLSPEAKEFVPRQSSHISDGSGHRLVSGQEGLQYAIYDGFPYTLEDGKVGGPRTSGGLPGYVTTCYPFVPSAETRFGGPGPRGRGKYNNNQQMFVPPQFSHPGFPRSRFPNPGKGFIQAWNQQQLTDLYQPFSNLPNGMPFDGGTYQNGFIRTNLPQVPTHDSKSAIPPQQTVPNTYMTSSGDAPQLNGYMEGITQWKTLNQELSVNNEKPSTGKSTKVRQLDGISARARKSSYVQTDFPESLANATLEDIPNSLYKRTRKFSLSKSRHKTRRPSRDLQNVPSDSDDNDFEQSHPKIYHRKNQVSNGTNPAAIGVAISNDLVSHGNQNVLSYKEIVTGNRKSEKTKELKGTLSTVPYSPATSSVMFSYASVAQGLSSHNKSGPVSMATKSDKDSCDSSGNNVKGNVKGGLENVNVAQIMKDLEKAGSLKEQSGLPSNHSAETIATSKICNQTGYAPVYTWGQSAITENQSCSEINLGAVSYSEKLKQQKALTENKINQVIKSEGQGSVFGFQRSKSGSSEIQGQESVDPKMDVKPRVVASEIGTDGQEQLVIGNDNLEESGGKKKRKRRRRRKKKTSESGAVSDDVNSGANDEITLHFEDDEEFPDLGGVVGDNTKESSPHPVPFSYSDILKTGASSPRQPGPVQDATAVPDDHSSENTGATGKETRNSRKRRKRREVANKAADAEMAEINLEQHMLELKMKQKHPLATKKSASPVRKPASPVRTSPVQQSIWKHPGTNSSNQPPSSGKKVSLLLPGTVAPDNASTARQPNPSAKQYSGILKTTQSSQPTQSASQSAPGGGGTLGVVGGGGKKSKQPITYDLGALIDALEEKKKEPPPKKEARPIINKKEEVRSANMLDSSAPIKRGKERENPKIKKPSPLKKVILKEREEKKRLRMLDEDETTSGAPVGIGVVSGESDLSQDASSSKGSMEVGLGTPASAELSPISQPSPSCISPMSPGASPISSGVNSPQTGSTQQIVKLKIHSRRFREYCNQVLDKEIDSYVTALLSDLVRFQDKQYHKDPIKAKAKRRFVLGLREVTKHLKLRKIKCVIISPNLEKIQSKGGLDDALNNILDLCNEQEVPFVFALGRRALGRACAKLVPVSVVGIFNYEGSEDNFKSLVSLTEKARDSYKEMISQIEKEIAEQPPRAHVAGVPHIFAHMGHSRTPSGCSVISFTSSILSEPISENYPYSEPETDNRGYEIEKGKLDDANVDDEDKEFAQNGDKESFGKDPYEADDESGGTKKSLNRTSGLSENVSQHINVRSNGPLTNTPLGQSSNMQSDAKNAYFVNVSDNHRNEIVDENSSDESDSEMLEPVSTLESVQQNCENEEEEDELSEDISDNDQSHEDCDTIQDLPYIDSVHHFDLHEILSTHSSKTLENGEDVLSTHSSKTNHSSRTPGDGTTSGEKNCKIKIDIKHGETTSTLSLKGKSCLDKENRTLSWVKEAQNLHFNDEIEKSGDADENQIEANNVSLECLDVVA